MTCQLWRDVALQWRYKPAIFNFEVCSHPADNDDIENTVEALVSDHLGNSEKWSQLELAAYKNGLS